ncbi:MAG: RagB/SusD family nutrient uptake outer membrane protein [Gemmatimonadales bacterium]
MAFWYRHTATALALTTLAGCSSLIEVEAPSRVRSDVVAQPSNAPLLVNSAGADLECALAHYVVATGLVGNELEIGTTLIVMKEYDKRDFNPTSSSYTNTICSGNVEGNVGLYKPLSTARFQGDNTVALLQGWTDAEVPNRQKLIATAANYAGYSLVLLGESMCSAAIDLGPELSPAQLFAEAETRFNTALTAAQAANDAALQNWARVGRARAKLRQGDKAGAAADATPVPIDFVMNATYSTDSPRRENLIWVHGQRSRTYTVDPSYRGLSFGGMADPRVQVTQGSGTASDGVTPLWIAAKYGAASSPIALATGVEARLIVAEAAGGQTAVDIINELHDRVGLPHFSSNDPAQIQQQIVEERRRAFFLDGHHLGDLRQYGIPLTPAPGVPFKDGGGVYQDQKCFPLPDVERLNNPNL